jgi:nicotinate-nucleotide adenylyltransferase
MRIGLMGGSFDPAHEGHRHCALLAMKRLGLQQVWWLVSPQNPLKPKSAPLAERVASARAMAGSPRIIVTAFEADHGLAFTADTLSFLLRRSGGARFVWVMGADSMARFHRWRRWRTILERMPVAIVPRPGAGARMSAAPAFAAYRGARVEPGRLLKSPTPAWSRLSGPVKPHSSTAIRAHRFSSGASRASQVGS